jgi:hypothetical protein
MTANAMAQQWGTTERTAYITGDTMTADLLDRINQLTEALGKSVAEYEELVILYGDLQRELCSLQPE